MSQPKFKPGQQWLSREGKNTFHILSTNEYGELFCVCVDGWLLGGKMMFYSSGNYYHLREDQYDLVTLIKDVE